MVEVVEETVEIVDTLECVGDLRSWPCGVRIVGIGDDGSFSLLPAPRGLGETGGKRKSGVLSPPPREVEGDVAEGGEERPGALLCDRFRFIAGRLDGLGRSGEEAERTMGGGGLSVGDSVGEN